MEKPYGHWFELKLLWSLIVGDGSFMWQYSNCSSSKLNISSSKQNLDNVCTKRLECSSCFSASSVLTSVVRKTSLFSLSLQKKYAQNCHKMYQQRLAWKLSSLSRWVLKITLVAWIGFFKELNDQKHTPHF